MAINQNRADRYLAVVPIDADGPFLPTSDSTDAGALAVVLIGEDGASYSLIDSIGDPTDAPYTDATGAAPGTMIALLKGIFINTTA